MTLADELHERAASRTGLTDFGDREYVDGLDALLEGYRDEAGLTEQGRAKVEGTLVNALAARLRTEAAWREHPAHAETPVTRPIFVTGLPRSGTTALHRLLCADPRHQGLQLWLAAAPQPRPPREAWVDNPDFSAMQAQIDRRNAAVPGLKGMHFMAADVVEECWWLEHQSMRSLAFPSVAHLPSYTSWLGEQDLSGTYRRHRRILQLIGMTSPERRWILKNPGHLFSLDALMAAYPDALVVQTHRDPRSVVASVSSLTSKASAGNSTVFEAATVGRDSLDLWGTASDRFLDARATYDPAQFADVRYDEFVADPVGTVARLYDAFGLSFDDEARARVTAADDVSKRGDRRPDHAYSLEEFGLSAGEVTERFDRYLTAFPELALS
ncbi:sulfotransferase [Nocardioides albidus]|uniref:Sulfotransferase n=1 Tax=Nocardioides albidus TaxID=1517589 RepID=A0A5C4VV46_9ACTN|nr:sulfotransferase [Nocardioides albidus]TNM39764.1 sulfotransferase [Nocardioides albidus]